MAKIIQMSTFRERKAAKKGEPPSASEYDWREEKKYRLLIGAKRGLEIGLCVGAVSSLGSLMHPHSPHWGWVCIVALVAFAAVCLPVLWETIACDKMKATDKDIDRIFKGNIYFECETGLKVDRQYLAESEISDELALPLADLPELKRLIETDNLTKFKLAIIDKRMKERIRYYMLAAASVGVPGRITLRAMDK